MSRSMVPAGPVGVQGATGATGNIGVPGGTGSTGSTGATGTITTTPATTTRTFNTTFQPSAVNPTLVSYTVQIVANFSLTGSQTGTVQLLSDSSNPPTTVRAVVSSGLSGTIAIGLNMNNTQVGPLPYIVPAGDFVLLTSSGSAAITMLAQVEVTL